MEAGQSRAVGTQDSFPFLRGSNMDGSGAELVHQPGSSDFIKEASEDLKESLRSVVRHLGDFDDKQSKALESFHNAFSALDLKFQGDLIRVQGGLVQLQVKADESLRRTSNTAGSLEAESQRTAALEMTIANLQAGISSLQAGFTGLQTELAARRARMHRNRTLAIILSGICVVVIAAVAVSAGWTNLPTGFVRTAICLRIGC
jgi:hypothetical protein